VDECTVSKSNFFKDFEKFLSTVKRVHFSWCFKMIQWWSLWIV
jgi:hypothetical protein